MAKNVTVTLYRPDGGTTREFNDVELVDVGKDGVVFKKRVEDVGEDTATVYEYTTNLKYLITERTTGPKNLI